MTRPSSPSLYHMLQATAAGRPRRRFLHHDGAWLTYGRMLERVDRLAAGLSRLGVRKGDSFAIALRNSPDFVAFYLALSKLGAVAVPVNFMITKGEELEFILRDCGASGVLTQKEFAAPYERLKSRLPALEHLLSVDHEPRGGRRLEEVLGLGAGEGPCEGAAGPEDPATILYTSGTTGRPKGAVLTHANLVTNCDACITLLTITGRDLFLCLLPMFHTFAWTACVLVPIRAGARVAAVSSITPPAPWLKLMGRLGVSIFAAVPQLYSVLAKEAVGLKGAVLKWYSFRRVRLGLSGAAPLPLETLKTFEARLGVPILEGYGLTETSPVVSINRPDARKVGTVGPVIPGVRIRILDEQEMDLPAGGEGEICVLGPNVTRGYHGWPEATREAFTRDGWFKTGDVGAIDADGYLSIRDRKKDMIIVKGLKVFPAQVEAVIASHPKVAEAAVVGVPGENGDELIKLFCVVKKGEVLDKAEMAAFLKQKLDPYKRPRSVEFVEALPKNALQKVLKRVLRQQELEKQRPVEA